MSFGSKESVEEHIKSLEKLNDHRGSKYDVTKDDRQARNGYRIIILACVKFQISCQFMLKENVLCLLVAWGM